MRLAIISNVGGYQWAGSEELWRDVAIKAQAAGCSVTACLHRDIMNSSELRDFRVAGGRVESWKPFPIARFEAFRQKIRPSFSETLLGKPDVLLVSLGSLPALTFVPGLVDFLANTTVPYVLLCQFNAECLPFSEAERTAVRKICELATKVVFVSKQNQTLAKRQLAMELAHSTVIPNPIRFPSTERIPPRKLLSTDEVRFGCVARMETLWKAQDLLLEILAGETWRTRSWKLKLFGSGPDEPHLRRCSSLFNLDDRVEFSGYVRDPAALWSDIDILLLPSRGEGMALVVLEAMMFQRPVVVTYVGGVDELLDDGVNGFVADVASVNSFGKAMERAWMARQSWKEMGTAAAKRAENFAAIAPGALLLKLLFAAKK